MLPHEIDYKMSEDVRIKQSSCDHETTIVTKSKVIYGVNKYNETEVVKLRT